MLDNLANSDVIVLAVLIGLILIVGITCIILTIKGDGKKKKTAPTTKKHVEPEIQMALATDNIPDLVDEEDDKTKEIISEDYYIREKEEEEIPSYEEVSEIMKEFEPVIGPSMDEDLEMIEPEEPIIEVEKLTIDTEEPETISYVKETISETPTRSSRTNIADVLQQMEADIEKQKYEEIDRYEEEQEENAVISYQELLNRKMALNDNNHAEPKHETRVERTVTTYEEEPVYKWKNEPKQFSSSEFISPIFGRDNNTKEYKKTVEKEELKTTYANSKDEALDETVDLLNALKEYRRNL